MKQTHQQQTLNLEEKIVRATTAKPKRNQFLLSLFEVLENPQYEHSMCWDREGKAFILKDSTFITDWILKKEFGGMKLNSFIRQLSYYGFKRVSRKSELKVYTHEQFRRNGKQFLNQIRRKGRSSEAKKIVKISNDRIDIMDQKFRYLQTELEKMRGENVALRSYIQTWSNENSYAHIEGMNRQNPSSNGFTQTFFSPQAQVNNYQPLSNTMQGNGAFLPTQHHFIEVYQPDYRANQVQAPVPERIFNETPATIHLDTPNFHEREMSHFNEESFEDDEEDEESSEESQEYEF